MVIPVYFRLTLIIVDSVDDQVLPLDNFQQEFMSSSIFLRCFEKAESNTSRVLKFNVFFTVKPFRR